MRIPIGAINTLMHGDDIQMCETCGTLPLFAPGDAGCACGSSRRAKTRRAKTRREVGEGGEAHQAKRKPRRDVSSE